MKHLILSVIVTASMAFAAVGCAGSGGGAGPARGADLDGNAGPVIVGTGGGRSEFSIAFARTNLKGFLSTCKDFDCPLTPAERNVLAQLTVLAANPPQSVFKTSAELSGKLFEVHASLGEVWFNQENLWLDSAKTKTYGVPDAVNLWIDVLAVYRNFPDAALADIKDGTYSLLKQTFETLDDDLGATVWKQSVEDKLYLFDSTGQPVDVHSSLENVFACGQGVPLSLQIFSGSWQLLASSSSENQYVLRLDVVWGCASKNLSRGEVLITVPAQVLSNDAFKIESDKLSFALAQ